MTEKDDIVFDPFAGVASAGVAAAIHGRRFWGCEISREYLQVGRERIMAAIAGNARYRPHDKPVQDPSVSIQSKKPISCHSTK
jgi:adenine-specific DNA-methyltransferase